MTNLKRLLLISSSRVQGYDYLEVCSVEIQNFLNKQNIKTVLFIPYAVRDHDKYLDLVEKPFKKWGFNVKSIHQYERPQLAIEQAEALIVGGGNTFRLLKSLYDFNLIDTIRTRVQNGVPYIGWSAGSNVATKSINTTNDMPIVYPPSLNALQLVPFNINPHYLDTDSKSTHRGETREQRILEYLEIPESNSVVGLREGTWLAVEGENVVLQGLFNARLFLKNEEPKEIEVGTNLSFLLKL